VTRASSRRRPRAAATPAPAVAPASPWPAVAVAAAAALTFAPAIGNGFVNLDDSHVLVENPMFRGFGARELAWMATAFHLGHWQPLTWLSYALDHLVWGMNPAGYHLTNVLLHAANAALVYLLAERLCAAAGVAASARRPAAVVGALLWALHPLRVEAVAWATARRDVLSTLFVLLALLAYCRPERSRGRLAGALAATIAASAAKESAMVVPALLVVLDVYPLRRLGGTAGWTGPEARRVCLEKVPFALVGLAAAAIAVAAQHAGGALTPIDELAPDARVAAAAHGIAFHLWKTVVPVALRPMYEYPSGFGLGSPLALAGLATSAAVVAALAAWRPRPAPVAALVAYAVALAPTLGLAQSGPQLVAERYGYLAMVAPSIVVGAVVASRAGTRAYPVVAIVCLALAALAAVQTTRWKDSTTLWTWTIAVDPGNALAHANLGDVPFRVGDFAAAERELRRAVELRPDVAGLHHDLALVIAAAGRLDAAVAEDREAVRLRPGFAPAWWGLGESLAALGRTDEAISALRTSLALDPGEMRAHATLAAELAARGDVDDAIAEYREALRLAPSPAVYNNLAALLADHGRAVDAVPLYRAAVALAPRAAAVHENLGHALAATGDAAGAAAAFREALRLDARLDGARSGLAALGAPEAAP
jgi:protein O-mannosyl-transferase